MVRPIERKCDETWACFLRSHLSAYHGPVTSLSQLVMKNNPGIHRSIGLKNILNNIPIMLVFAGLNTLMLQICNIRIGDYVVRAGPEPGRKILNKADTAFILASAGLVLLMTPGLALFYAGMAVNPGGVDGLFAGNPGQLLTQIFGAVVVCVYAFTVSWVIFKVIQSTIGLRLTDEAEVAGMDSTEHSETAYNN